MQKKKTRVILDIWLARIGSVFSWIFLVFWAIMGAVGLAELGEAKDGVHRVMPFVCLGLAALHWQLIRKARNTGKLVEDFRLYSSVLAQDPEKEISGIAEALKIPQETVMRRLQEMCRRGYFSGHINFQTRQMVLEPESGLSIEHCPGCGATTAISSAGDVCRYCGTPLKQTDYGRGTKK